MGKHPARLALRQDILRRIERGNCSAHELVEEFSITGVISNTDIYARLSGLKRTHNIRLLSNGDYTINTVEQELEQEIKSAPLAEAWRLLERLMDTMPPYRQGMWEYEMKLRYQLQHAIVAAIVALSKREVESGGI